MGKTDSGLPEIIYLLTKKDKEVLARELSPYFKKVVPEDVPNIPWGFQIAARNLNEKQIEKLTGDNWEISLLKDGEGDTSFVFNVLTLTLDNAELKMIMAT